MNPIVEHKQLIVRAEVANFFGRFEQLELDDWLFVLVEKMGMRIMSGPHSVYVDRDGLRGWSGSVLIETSHIALHVWEDAEPKLLQLDVYTCGAMQPDTIAEHLRQFNPSRIEYLLLDREYKLEIKPTPLAATASP